MELLDKAYNKLYQLSISLFWCHLSISDPFGLHGLLSLGVGFLIVVTFLVFCLIFFPFRSIRISRESMSLSS